MPQWLRQHLPAALAALLALVVYAVSVGGDYIYDDVTILQTDARLRDPSLWGHYWTDSYNDGVDNLYRPLTSMSFAIEWWLHGDRKWVFHLVNILLHAAVSAMVAELAGRLTASSFAALVAGLLFAALPIHVEAVANIVGRSELMCALGTLGTLILFMRPMTRPRALAITGCFLLALLSKEQGMLVPLLLLTLAVCRRFLSPNSLENDRQSILLLTFLLCMFLAGYIVWREHILKFWWDRNFLDWTINPMVNSEWHPWGGTVGADRILMPIALLGRYTGLLIAPIKLSPDYGAKVIGWTVAPNDPYLYIGIAAILAWSIVLVFGVMRRSLAVVFGCLALAFTYGLIGNIATLIGTNFAERLMYLPSAFFILIIAAGFEALPRRLAIALLSVLVILFSVRSFAYSRRWNDKLEFYKTCFQEQPQSIRLCMLVVSEYEARKQFGEAERMARIGRETLPEYWEIWVQSAVVAMDQGKFDEADQFLLHADKIRPSPRIHAWMEHLNELRKAAATLPATQP